MRAATIYLVISILAGACGQLMLKAGLIALGPLDIAFENFKDSFTLPSIPGLAWIAAGVIGYFMAVILWVKVLKKYPLNMAYPLLSLGYVVVYLGSVWWPAVNESFTQQKTLGVFLIIIGVIIVTRFSGDNRQHE
jgi:undecaprenyl phosphate-alpha-L-ara4N flippase subunit ArnF